MAEVVVIGAGVGGAATAVRLAAAGHRVRLFERRPDIGGKLAEVRSGGFGFGIGPSLLTLPAVFAELARLAGVELERELDLVPLDPICRYHFADGTVLDARSDPGAMEREVDRFAPGHGAAWRAFYEWGGRCWAATERAFLSGPARLPSDLARGGARLGDLLAVAPGRTLAGQSARFFADPRLRQYAARYASYSGSAAEEAPAALGCIPYLEHTHGGWYVLGGLIRLRDLLAALLHRTGVEVRTGVRVDRIVADRTRVRGVVLADGTDIAAEAVVVNADAARAYTDLFPDRRRMRRIARLGASSSALLILVGLRGRTPGLAHHNIVFPADPTAEPVALRAGRPADDPTVYIGCSAVDDPAQAPPGGENWTILLNWPPGLLNAPAELVEGCRDRVLDRLAPFGLEPDRIACQRLVTPADLDQRYATWQGAIYGTRYRGRLAAIRRPGNRGPRRGLYLVGGSVHPGGGLPMVAIGARIVADLVDADFPP